MEQSKSPFEGRSGAASPTPPPWMQRATPYAPERRAKMLEHMARARSAPQPQAVPQPQDLGGKDLLHDVIGHIVLFGIIALMVQSRIPLYLGAFLFVTDGERIARAFGTIGIRFERDTIGPDLIKGFISLFAWIALLASLHASVPTWLAASVPPADSSWSFIAGIALALAVVDAIATRAMRHVLKWLGWEIGAGGLISSTVKLVLAVTVLAGLILLGLV